MDKVLATRENQFKKFNILLKRELFTLLIQSGSYVASFIFLFGFSFHYFILNGFFTYNQNVDLRPFFSAFPFLMIAFIPAVSFNIFKNDTPFEALALSDFLKIFAKFLSIFIIFCFNVIVSFFILLFTLRFGTLEISQIFTSYFMILLYGSMLIALSIFIQSIFENKIASLALLTTVLFILNTIHILPKYHIVNNDFFLSVIKALSFSWHFENALNGIFSTSDVFFYLILTFVFLFFSVEIRQKRKGKSFFSLRNALVILIFVLSLIDTSLLSKKIDLTENKAHSLTKQSVQVAKNLMNPVNITYAYSRELKNLYPQINDIMDFLYKYHEVNPAINIYVEDVDKRLDLQKKLKNLGIESQPFSIDNSLDKQVDSFYSAIIIEDEKNCLTIPFVFSTNGLEFLLTSKLSSIQNKKSFSTVIFCKNNLNLEKDYPYLVSYLESMGIDVYTDMEIEELENLRLDIPVILIGGSSLSQEELSVLEGEIEKGRKFLFCTNPYTVNVYGDWKIISDKNPLIDMLRKYGFDFSTNLCLDTDCFEMTMQNQNFVGNYTKVKYPFWVETGGKTLYWPVSLNLTESLSSMPSALFLPSSRNTTDFSVSVLLETSEEGFEKYILKGEFDKIDTSPFSKENFQTDLKMQGKKILAAKNASIAVIADQYFPSFLMTYTNSLENLNFVSDLAVELNDAEFLLELKNKTGKNLAFTKIKSEEELKSCRVVTLFFTLFIIPLASVLVPFLIVFCVRKKKNAHFRQK